MSDQKPWESYQDQGATAEGDQKPWESFGGETKPEDKGFIGTLVDGAKSTGRAISSTYNTYTGDGQAVVDNAKAQELADEDKSQDIKNFQSDWAANTGAGTDEEVGLWDAIKGTGKAIIDNPRGAALSLAEQFPNSVPTLAAGWAGAKGGAMAGGAVGSAFAGVGAGPGALIGGAAGFIGGMFLGNTLTETGYKAQEYAADGEFTPDEQSAAMTEGAKKAGVITAVDALTFGIGGKVSSTMRRTAESAVEAATRKTLIDAGVDISDTAALAAARSNPQIASQVVETQKNAARIADSLRKRAAEAGVLLTMETVGEGLGEYLGELAATGQASVSEAVLESFLSLGQSGVQTMFNLAKARGSSLTNQEWVDAANGIAPEGIAQEQMPVADGIWDEPTPEAKIDMGQMQDGGVTPAPVFNPEDIERNLGPTPSEQMGLNPDAGPLSAAASIAVDTGTTEQLAQQSALQQAAETAEQAQKRGGKQGQARLQELGVQPEPREQVQSRAEEVAAQTLASGGTEADAMRAATDTLIDGMATAPDIEIASDAPAAVSAAKARTQESRPEGSEKGQSQVPIAPLVQVPKDAPASKERNRSERIRQLQDQGFEVANETHNTYEGAVGRARQLNSAKDGHAYFARQVGYGTEDGGDYIVLRTPAKGGFKQGFEVDKFEEGQRWMTPSGQIITVSRTEDSSKPGMDRDAFRRRQRGTFNIKGMDETYLLTAMDNYLLLGSDTKQSAGAQPEQRSPEQQAQYIWDSMNTFERNAAAANVLGMRGVPAKNAATKSWDKLSTEQRAKLVTGLESQQGKRWIDPNQKVTDQTGPVLQNRDRTSQDSINQMRSISNNPDYSRLKTSGFLSDGAPVVIDENIQIPASQMGVTDTASAGSERFNVQYAVVEADQLMTSNSIDGTTNAEYQTGAAGKARAIAGNGRITGLQSAWAKGNANQYKADMAADRMHGIDPSVIEGMRNPILVRLLPQDQVTDNIGDLSNRDEKARLSPVEQAKTDMGRIDLDSLKFTADGAIGGEAIHQFRMAQPAAERVTEAEARKRLTSAIFQKAYGNDQLTEIQSGESDDAKSIMSALAQAAPSMSRLEGAGEFDIRPLIAQAGIAAVNAARRGTKLADYVQQSEMGIDPMVYPILEMMLNENGNIRSSKYIGEQLTNMAKLAYDEANAPSSDMFGEKPKRTAEQAIQDALTGVQGYGQINDGRGQEGLGQQGRPEPDAQMVEGPEGGRERPADTRQAAPAQSEAEQEQPAAVERPENWRSNYLQAARVARQIGINPKDHKKLPDLVAAIEERDSQAVAEQINEAASEAATSPENNLPEPTAAQKEAGNYTKGHIRLHGLEIAIENPRGSTRSGVDEDGEAWAHKMSDHYGYIKRTTGADGDHVDVYIGGNPESDRVFVVDQINQQSGDFDEHKVMMGFGSEADAVAAYRANFDKGWKVGPVRAMSVDEFKGWLNDGDTSKPAAEQKAEDSSILSAHGLPEGASFETGKTGLVKGRIRAVLDDAISNWQTSKDAAAKELASVLANRKVFDERAKAREEAISSVRDSILAGKQPADGHLKEVFGLQPHHTYVPQADVGWFLVEHLGVSRNKIKASLGHAGGTITSDSGTQYPIAYPRKLHEVFGTKGADAAQPITRADVEAAQQQAAAIIGARIDAMKAGDVNKIAKKFLPTMGMKPTMSKANNKAAMTDPKINLEAAAAEVGATLPAEVTRALQADMEGRVVDARQAKPAAHDKAQQEWKAEKPATKRQSISDVMKKIDAHNKEWRELRARHSGWIEDRGAVRADAPKEVKAAVKAHKAKSAQLQAEYDAASAQGRPDEPIMIDGLRVSPTTVKAGDTVKPMWMTQSVENAEREKRGERQLGGDSLHDTKEQAIAAAKAQARDAKDKAQASKEEAEAQRLQEQKKATKKADTINGFTEGMAPNKAALAAKALDKRVRFRDKVASVREHIEAWHKAGELEVSTTQEPRVKPMSRTAFNRADQRQQDAHEKRMKEAGNKTVYWVNDIDLGKTAHDYASHLLAQGDQSQAPVQRPVPQEALPEILTTKKKQYLNKMARNAGIKKGSPGYQTAMDRLEAEYDADLDAAHAALPFEQYNELNSDTPESINRAAWEGLREDYGLSLETQTEESLAADAERVKAAQQAEERESKKAEREEAKRKERKNDKARADETVDDFQLGQDADQQMSGVTDMFSQEAADPEAKAQPSEAKASSPKKAATKAPAGVIEDAGEKLGGARKDELRTVRERLDDMSDEAIASSKLSELWPKSEVDRITDPFHAAAYHAVRAYIPTKPRATYRVKRWVDQVKAARGLLQDLADIGADASVAKMRETSPSLNILADQIELLMGIDRAHWSRVSDAKIRNGRYSQDGEMVPGSWVELKIDKRSTSFYGHDSIASALPAINQSLDSKPVAEKKQKFSIYTRTATGEVFISADADRERRALKSFESTGEARKYLDDHHGDLVAAWEAVKNRENVTKSDMRRSVNEARVGQDYRGGKDVTPEQFLDQFGFRGVEFGNWVKQGKGGQERQGILNDAYDAFMDLAGVIGVPPKALSLEGRLGIGFGSRGRGGSHAAHYEPGRMVINLTKTKGAGSLAHEWFHAMDNYFAHKRGVPEFKGDNDAYRKGAFVTYRPEPMLVNKKHPSMRMTRAQLSRYQAKHPNAPLYAEESWERDASHPEGVRPVVEKAFAELVHTLDASPMTRRSSIIDKGKVDGYWSQIIERGARAFETYVIARLADQGARNDYLANVQTLEEFSRDPGRYPYLTPDEQGPVNEAFDKLFSTIETQQTDSGDVVMFSFAGRRSGTAMHKKLDEAIRQTAMGINPEQVRQDTGWHRGVDGKWRYEISDADAELKVSGKNAGDLIDMATLDALTDNRKQATVGDLMSHPKLFAAYPQLADIVVQKMDNPTRTAVASVRVTGNQMVISLNPRTRGDYVASALIHELQHAIQTIEGFARGGNARMAARLANLSVGDKAATNVYMRLAGEIEARNTQARMKMDDEFRKLFPPADTQDVTDAEAIVTFNGTEAADFTAREPITELELKAVFAARFPKLTKALDRMLEKGAKRESGGLVILKNADPLKIARKFSQITGRNLSDAIRMFDGANDAQGFYDPRTGLTFLVGPSVTETNAAAVVLHEAVHGQQNKRLDQAAVQMLVNRKKEGDKNTRDFLDRVVRRMARAEGGVVEQEAAAYIVEQAILEGRDTGGHSAIDGKLMTWIENNLGKTIADLVRDFVKAYRQFAIRHGLGLNVTVDDMIDYAKASMRQSARSGAQGGTGAVAASKSGESIVSGVGSNLVTLYHGTNKDGELGIRRDGVIIGPVFLTPSEDVANDYAGDGTDPIVVEVPADKLMVDFDLPGARLLTVDQANNYTGNEGWTIDDYIDDGRSLGVTENILLEIDGDIDSEVKTTNIRFSRTDQTETEAFKKWFGDSKIVDADGKPLVVYHGTKHDFTEFQLGSADRRDGGWFGDGFYLTASQDLASSYAMRERDHSLTDRPANVMPVYVRMSNPYRINLAELSYDEGSNFTKKYGGNEGFRKWLADNGYDGVIGYHDPEIAGQGAEFWEVVVFDPAQIKSATGNVGTFDPENPDIRFSRAGRAATATADAFERMAGRVDAATQDRHEIPSNWTPEQQAAASKFDTFNPKEPLADRVRRMREATGKKVVQKVFDQYRSLRDLSQKGYMQAHLARGAETTLDAVLRFGVPELRDGAVGIKTGTKGFIETLKKLGNQEEVNRFLMFVTAQRADALSREHTVYLDGKVHKVVKDQASAAALQAQLEASEALKPDPAKVTVKHTSRENLFTREDIDAMLKFADGTNSKGQARRILYAQVQREMNQFQKAILDIGQEAGVVNGESRADWESDFYIPFYRVMQDDNGNPTGQFSTSDTGLMRQEVIKRLKGGTENLGDPLNNLMANWTHMLEASMKNMAANNALDGAESMGIAAQIPKTDADGTMWTLRDGKRVYWEVADKDVLESLTALNFQGYNNGFMKAAGAFKRMLTMGVTINPTFRIRSAIRDILHAMAVADVGYNPLKNAVEGWKQTGKDSELMKQMQAGGAAISFGLATEGKHGDMLRRRMKQQIGDDQVLNTRQKFNSALTNFYDRYMDLGDRLENNSRVAAYQRAMDKTGDHLIASFEGRDIMNFTSMGSSAAIRALAQVLPFFNARLQGMYKLGRGGKSDPRRFASVVGTIGMASALLYLLQADDDEYKSLPDYVRDTYWPIKLGDKWFYIPKPFEVGSMATVIERFTELAMAGGDYKARDFRDTVISILINNLEMNPVPQIILPAAEAWYNYDMFRGRPIDSMAMERLLPGDRYNANTSAGAVALGRAMNVSPQKIEHMVNGYFGWLGLQALSVSDLVARSFMDMPSSTRRDMTQTNNWFIVGDFLKESGSIASKYSNRFYDVQRDINQIYATANYARNTGDMERYRDLMSDPKMASRPMIRAATSRINRLNQQIRATIADRNLSAADKTARLRELHKLRSDIAKSVDEKYRG